MSVRQVILVLTLALSAVASAGAQTTQPYIVSELGGSFGDGGSVPAVGLGFGFLTPRNLGLEIEVSYLPDLDFGDPGLPRIAIFPPITMHASGRIVGLHTHVVGVLPGGGTKLRAFVIGGGGITDVRQRIRIESPVFFTPTFPGTVPPDFPFPFGARVFESSRSETSLVLSAGAGFEYGVTQHLGVGMAVRYQRLFSDPVGLDMARAAARVTWRF